MPSDHAAPQAAEPKRRIPLPGRREVVLGMLVVGLAVLGLWYTVATGLVGPDPTCSPCHPASKVAAPHTGATCYSCHSAPGTAARASRLALDVVYASRGLPGKQVEAAVSNDSCLRCHPTVLAGIAETGGIRIDHRVCVKPTTACTDCHSDVGHGRIASDRAVSMDRCSRCHQGVTAPKVCDTCHVGTPTRRDALNAWAVTHGKNRHETHGMGDLNTCFICHKRDDCSECHLPVPHTQDWPMRHGTEAIERGDDTCMACHVPELCDGCHKTEMPHPEGWLARHSGAVPKTDIENRCRSCHAVGDCRDCHLKHIHPGLSQPEIVGGGL